MGIVTTYPVSQRALAEGLRPLAPDPLLAFDQEQDDYFDQTTRDILQRERQHQHAAERFVCWQTQEGQRFEIDTQDRTIKDLMDQLDALNRRILRDDHSPCLERPPRRGEQGSGVTYYRLTRLGHLLRACCVNFLKQEEQRADWLLAYADYVFRPDITVMLRAMSRYAKRVGLWLVADTSVSSDSPDMDAVHAMRGLTRFIRRVCRSWAFKNEQKKFERQAESNFASGRELLRHWFSRRSRLLTLRVDLYFRPWAKSVGTSKEAERLMRNFQRRLYDGRVVPDFLACIYKREDGISRGAHWHALILLDGHHRRNAYGLSRQIGEDWMRQAGQARSSYFNCYSRAHRFKFNGLGMIHVGDIQKLIGLRAALTYMTKRDCVLKFDSGKDQHFRTSKPRLKTGHKRGAPRKHPDSLSTFDLVFSGPRNRPLEGIPI